MVVRGNGERGVHVFEGNVLLAHFRTSDPLPDEFYEIDGIEYQAVSFGCPRLEASGGEGWDVQVRRCRA
jgi:hypothetical protein